MSSKKAKQGERLSEASRYTVSSNQSEEVRSYEIIGDEATPPSQRRRQVLKRNEKVSCEKRWASQEAEGRNRKIMKNELLQKRPSSYSRSVTTALDSSQH